MADPASADSGGLRHQIPLLHRRASEWYQQHGWTADAIRHALAANDYVRAAELTELAVPAMRRNRQEATLLGWLKALPDKLLHERPVLSVAYAATLLYGGITEGVESRLRDAERWLESAAAPTDGNALGAVVVDQEEFRSLPGMIAIYRAGFSLARGNIADTVHHAQQALTLSAEDDHVWRGAAAAILGLAAWISGELEAAYRSYAEGMSHLQRAGYLSDAIGGTTALADIRIIQGRLREAMRTYERALQLATEQDQPAVRGTADMYVGMSELHRERNELHVATQHLMQSKEQGEQTGFPQNPYRWRVAMARIRWAEGELEAALILLHEAEALYVSDFRPNVSPVAALKSRLWIAQGRLADALGWVREKALSAQDDLSYLREVEHITLARLLLALHQSDPRGHSLSEVKALLARLLIAAEAGGRMGTVIEILVLQALAHQMQEDITAALASLARALSLAEPEGYVRIFVDEGPLMAQLLREAANRGIMPTYTARLLTAIEDINAQPTGTFPLLTPPLLQPPIPQRAQQVIEPLSERELEVLRLLGTDLSGPEIARQLIISQNTLNTHTKNIYSKLAVNNRRSAVRRAEELDLLSPS
jgi:LuxR family maltose regulon positive regulatory protein